MCCHIHVQYIISVPPHAYGVDDPESPSVCHFYLFSVCQSILVKSGPTIEGCGWYPWIVTVAQGQGVHATYGLPHLCWPYAKC